MAPRDVKTISLIEDDVDIVPEVESGIEPKRPKGRPRSESSRVAILAAAYRSLQRQPIAAISTVHIARDAGVSTATLYRWWSTKEELLLAAFLHEADHELVLKPEGLPLERLKEYVLGVGRFFTGEHGIVVVRLLTAIQDDAALRKQFLERVYSPRDKEIRLLVDEAVKQNQLPADVEVGRFLDSIIGPLLTRLLIRHERCDERFVGAVFERMVIAARAQS
jgi:AcrR family transcriptional regulator